MGKAKKLKYTAISFSTAFTIGIYIFFAFFNNSHLHFEEQYQLFLLTFNYLIDKLLMPGGLAGYLGEFLTQFYYLSLAGPAIIALLLLLLQQVIMRLLNRLNTGWLKVPLSFIPSVFAGMLLCNEFYPLSFLVAFTISIVAGLVYTGIQNDIKRLITGLIFIPILYWLAGGVQLTLLLIILFNEFYIRKAVYKAEKSEKLRQVRLLSLILYPFLVVVIPLMVQRYYMNEQWVSVFFSRYFYNIPGVIPTSLLILIMLPFILMLSASLIKPNEKNSFKVLYAGLAGIIIISFFGFRSFFNSEAEYTMTYDYLVREQKWNDVQKFAEKHPPANYLSLSMLNLSLSMTGQMGNRLFNYDQHGINGLFLSFNSEYVAPLMGNEIFYNLGLVNASQQYAFESMETIPSMNKSARVIKRLAETNLINGQYKVSEKYLRLLEKTIFYRRWAKTAMTYLYNEDKINNNANWGEKRRFLVKDDYFFHVQYIETALSRMVNEHPDNKRAFEYLMAFYLINKDMKHFSEYIPGLEKLNYRQFPVVFQEAIIFIIASGNTDPFTNSPGYISQDTRLRLKGYVDILNTYPDAQSRLRRKYSGTYWYYLHYNDYQYNKEDVIQKNLY